MEKDNNTKILDHLDILIKEFSNQNINYDVDEKYVIVTQGTVKMHLRLETLNDEVVEKAIVDNFIKEIRNGKTKQRSIQPDKESSEV